MTTYRLVDRGYPFKKIMTGKAWVGRVVRHASGSHYLARIKVADDPAIEFTAPTEIEAFEGAVARLVGYESAADLKASNRVARAINRERNARTRHVVNEMMRGNFEPLDRLLGVKK